MIGKGVGVLALAAVLGFVAYYETSSLQLQQLSAAPDSRALLAQAPAASGTAGARTECKGGETLTVTAGSGEVTSSGTCNLPTNTCEVIINAPDKPPAVVSKCCRPEDGVCFCSYGGAPCPPIKPLVQYKYKCTQSSQKNSSVRIESQVAATAQSSPAKPIKIPCEDEGKYLAQARPTATQANANTGSPASATQANTNTASPAPKTPVATAPTAPQNDFRTGLQNPTDTTGRQPGQSAVQQNNQTFSQIQAEGAKGGTGFGQTGQQTLPGQTQTATQPTGPAFEQSGIYRPGYSNPSGELSGSTRPGYFSPSRAQSTFGSSGFSSRSSGRVAASFISGFASLIGGLFSVPTNSVVNYVQSFVGGGQQQTPPNNNQNGGQQQTYAPGQVVVVVPYPMPTSRKGDTLAQLPPPPTSTTDSYAELRELARQADRATGSPTSTGEQDDRVTSAFTGEDEQTQLGTTGTGNSNANKRGGATPSGRGNAPLDDGLQMGTTSAFGKQATSTHATTTSYKEPKVVEVGIPVDITDLGSYEAVLAYLKGDWARTEHTALQNKVALAQAEVQQEAIRAQLEALQDARAAGLCDDSCAASLTVLQNELPVMQSRVQALQTAIEKDAQPRPSSPPPTVGQINRVIESLAEPTYKAPVPRSAAGEPTAVSVSEQEALPEVPQSKSEAVVTRVVQSIWNFLKSIFLPPTTESAKPRPSCSLFASLFGKCK